MLDCRALLLRALVFDAAILLAHRIVQLLPKYLSKVGILTEVGSIADHVIHCVDVLHAGGLHELLVETNHLFKDAQLVWLIGSFDDESARCIMLFIASYQAYQHLDVIFALLEQEEDLEPRDMVRLAVDAHHIERIEVLRPEFQVNLDVVKYIGIPLDLSVREIASLLLVQILPFGLCARGCRHSC